MDSLNFSTDFSHWVFNYLKHREQIGSNCSSYLTVKYGGPQGSVLEPILFNRCIADTSSITPNSNCIQYANDSAIHGKL